MEVLQKVATEARRFQQDLEPCDSECKRFRELINKWPVDKPKGAIVILTQVSRVHQLKALLEALDKYFLDVFKYPIVLYHEENYLPYFEQVRGFSKADIFFQQVTFKIPEFVNMSSVPEMACLKGIGESASSSFKEYLHWAKGNMKAKLHSKAFSGKSMFYSYQVAEIIKEKFRFHVCFCLV